MAQRVNRPLGLHCLLYLLADRICRPVSHYWGGSLTESLITSEHGLVRVAGWVIEGSVRVWEEDVDKRRVWVPCRPTVEVLQIDLESRLLMAALLECRDRGRVELRLGEPSRRRLFSGGRVQVTLLAGPDVGGLCGEILKQFPRRGEQGADLLLTGMGSPIATVKFELAEHGYMRQTLKRHRVVGNKVQAVVDCERIQTLAEDCALAMDWWDQAWAADVPLSHALLADCTKSLKPKGGA